MSEKFEYVAATIAIAFGSQWAIRFFQNYKSKSQVRRDEIDNLNEIIDALREQVAEMKAEIKELKAEIVRKDKAYRAGYSCLNSHQCPIIKELNQ